MNILLILIGKLISFLSKILNKGNGSTWPGEIALTFNPNFIKQIISKNPDLKIILIAGTNGKTTTSLMIYEILKSAGFRVFRNESGANLLNGIASSFIKNASSNGKINFDFGIFEVDENNLPIILKNISPYAILLLNLFRDQLDRYGELDLIAKKWIEALKLVIPAQAGISKDRSPISSRMIEPYLILNADDPLISFIGEQLKNKKEKIFYFGLPENLMKNKKLINSADSIYCPNCGEKLIYKKISYSHLGDWYCKNCGFRRKDFKNNEFKSNFSLDGLYNKYNTFAALAFAKILKIDDQTIENGLKNVKPAFGRGEKIEINGKFVQIFLSKNPTSFNQSLETILEIEKNPIVLFVLNDRIPDGRDISWIWDIDLESYVNNLNQIIVSGDRVYDMAIRINYADKKSENFENLKDAINFSLEKIKNNETLYIMPTYSAMLDAREILTGRKIL